MKNTAVNAVCRLCQTHRRKPRHAHHRAVCAACQSSLVTHVGFIFTTSESQSVRLCFDCIIWSGHPSANPIPDQSVWCSNRPALWSERVITPYWSAVSVWITSLQRAAFTGKALRERKGLLHQKTNGMCAGINGKIYSCIQISQDCKCKTGLTCLFFFRIVCEMDAAPPDSKPGPVHLCVGECRPELQTRSSQLYSFVVRTWTLLFPWIMQWGAGVTERRFAFIKLGFIRSTEENSRVTVMLRFRTGELCWGGFVLRSAWAAKCQTMWLDTLQLSKQLRFWNKIEITVWSDRKNSLCTIMVFMCYDIYCKVHERILWYGTVVFLIWSVFIISTA